MATEITMPKLSDTMTEGQFICWRKNVGDPVERGEIIAEVETDKAVMELEAFASGTLIKTVAREGDIVPVGTVLGYIGNTGETPSTTEVPPSQAGTTTGAAQNTDPDITVRPESHATVLKDSPDIPAPEMEKASPMVRRMAREQGIDLSRVNGSGPDGRITQEDLRNLATAKQTGTDTPVAPSLEPDEKNTPTPQEPLNLSATPRDLRRAIAEVVTRSWNTIPHFNVTMEIGMEACREIVQELKESERQISYLALTLKACAVALEQFPLLLAESHESSDDIPISIAVALPDGVLMPVIRQCKQLSLAEISHETSRLSERSRNGKLLLREMSGARFSLSNLGMFGVDEFNALIMPEQIAILAMGAVTERPIVREGRVVIAPTMRVTLSCDHRVVDGAYAARFLSDLRRFLERPVALLV